MLLTLNATILQYSEIFMREGYQNPGGLYLTTAVFLDFEPYYKVVGLVEKLSPAYFRISKIWIQTWIQIFNMKILIFDISQEHSILILTIDLRVLGHGEQLCLLDFLAEMQFSVHSRETEDIMKSIKVLA